MPATSHQQATSPPTLSVVGVSKTHARRAIVWLRARSLLAFYDKNEIALKALEFKHGREWTYRMMHNALRETRLT